jgi:hypothetical protein
MSTSAKKSVAIYGGGIAGAVLANRLSRDFDVVPWRGALGMAQPKGQGRENVGPAVPQSNRCLRDGRPSRRT